MFRTAGSLTPTFFGTDNVGFIAYDNSFDLQGHELSLTTCVLVGINNNLNLILLVQIKWKTENKLRSQYLTEEIIHKPQPHLLEQACLV